MASAMSGKNNNLQVCIISLLINLLIVFQASAEKKLSDYEIVEVAAGLNYPWSITFLPDNQFLVSERIGQIRLVRNGVVSDPISNTPEVFSNSQGGLFDIMLHPEFERNGWIYISYAWGNKKSNGTRVVRGRLAGMQLVNIEILFTSTPLKNTPVHYGGRMAFLPDNTWVVSIGDGFDFRESAQKLDSTLGKIVRLRDNGSVPVDNPFTDNPDAHPEIYSLGHRNPQGVVYDPKRQLLFSSEHGPKGGDEINIITPGSNYGWPVVTDGSDYSGAAISPFKDYPGMIAPLLNWTPSIAPSSIAVYNGSLFPELHGDLLTSTLKSKEVRWIQMKDERPVAEVSLFRELDARIRDVKVGPDGALYLLTDSANGKLLKIEPL